MTARASVSTRTLYNRYSDKLALFAACLEVSSLEDHNEPPFGGVSLHADLTQFASQELRHVNRDRPVQLARIIYRESISFPQFEAVSRRQFDRHQLEPVRRILTAHGFEPAQTAAFAIVYLSITFGHWQSRIVFGDVARSLNQIDQDVETSTALFLNGALQLKG